MQTQIKDVAGGLASLGRYGDTYMVHAAEGETVIPAEILQANPQLKLDLFRQMRMMGIQDPNRYIVGNTLNSLNPITGQPEFFFKKLWKMTKKIAPVVVGAWNPGAGAALGAVLGGTSKNGGIKGALGGAAAGYFGGHALKGGIGSFTGMPQGATFGSKLMAGLRGAGGGLRTGFGNLAGTLGMPNLSRGIHGIGVPTGAGTMVGTPGAQARSAAAMQNLINQSQPMAQQQGGGGQGSGQPGGNFWSGIGSFLSGSGGKMLGGLAAAGIPAYLGMKYAKKFQEEQQDPKYQDKLRRAADPVGESGKDYFAMTLGERRSPEGQKAARMAGITPMMTREALARSTGMESPEAEQFFESMGYNPTQYAAGGGRITGPGTGTSDSIPAQLSNNEYVMTAKAVRGAGNGNTDLGAARMYDLMSRFEGLA